MAYEHDFNLLMQAHFTLFSRGVLILSLDVRDFFLQLQYQNCGGDELIKLCQ